MPTIAEKWVQEGVEKEIEKERLTIAEKMIERGMSDKEIRTLTGISIERIEGMRGKRSSEQGGK